MAMLGNYLDSVDSSWIGQDLLNLPMLLLIGIAGLVRLRCLQWAASIGVWARDRLPCGLSARGLTDRASAGAAAAAGDGRRNQQKTPGFPLPRE